MRNRRDFIKKSLLSTILLSNFNLLNSSCKASSMIDEVSKPDQPAEKKSFFESRGLVLSWNDITTLDWPYLAFKAGLNTLSFHASDAIIASDAYKKFMTDCKSYQIKVEFEQHAMYDLLPRSLFEKDAAMFRMDENGNRVKDFNCCPSSKDGLEIIAENARLRSLKQSSTTGRFFYWLDDGGKKCLCPKCKAFSFSDQALLIENEIIKSIKKIDKSYSLSHLAYTDTIPAPVLIKPEPGIFLEYAPFERRWDTPLENRDARREGVATSHGDYLDHLDANLKVFKAETAQILEYWLDVSLFSAWKKPAVKLPWNPHVCKSDIETYARRGIKHISSFGAYIDGDYLANHKDLSFVDEYGAFLNSYVG